jgi:hypothetical protein
MHAVEIHLRHGGGTMHRVTGALVQRLWLAADRESVYLRVVGGGLAPRLDAGELAVALLQDGPRRGRLSLVPRVGSRDSGAAVVVSIPFRDLAVQPGDRLRASLLVTDAAGHVLEQHPAQEPFEFGIPGPDHDAVFWVV